MNRDENNDKIPETALYEVYGRRGYTGRLCFLYAFGAVLGFFFADRIYRVSPESLAWAEPIAYVIKAVGLFFLLLLFATSTVGWFLIPVLFVSVGFSVSADTIWLLRSGEATLRSRIVSGIPAVLAMTALLSLGSASMGKAAVLRNMYSRLPDGTDPSVPGMRLVFAACFIAGSAAAAYYFASQSL